MKLEYSAHPAAALTIEASFGGTKTANQKKEKYLLRCRHATGGNEWIMVDPCMHLKLNFSLSNIMAIEMTRWQLWI